MNLTYERAKEMYLNDPEFHELVKSIRHAMVELRFTPFEMRAAVTFAAIQAEMERPVNITISKEEWENVPLEIREKIWR